MRNNAQIKRGTNCALLQWIFISLLRRHITHLGRRQGSFECPGDKAAGFSGTVFPEPTPQRPGTSGRRPEFLV